MEHKRDTLLGERQACVLSDNVDAQRDKVDGGDYGEEYVKGFNAAIDDVLKLIELSS